MKRFFILQIKTFSFTFTFWVKNTNFLTYLHRINFPFKIYTLFLSKVCFLELLPVEIYSASR